MEKKITKKQKEIVDFIFHILNIDVSDKVSYIKNKVIKLDVSQINSDDLRNIEYVGIHYNRFSVVPGGYKAKALIIK